LWLIVALVGGGCNSILGINELTVVDAPPGTETDIDAFIPADASVPIDSVDAPPNMLCSMLADECYMDPLPAGDIVLGAVNTETDGRCTSVTQTNGQTFCAIVGGSIKILAAGAVITGDKPLMLVATTTITIDGDLDAGSTGAPARSGPGIGGTPNPCNNPNTGGGGQDGGGGGAGGTFSTKGGDGGDGAGNMGGNGANATNAQVPTTIRPGCRGGTGGKSATGVGGNGGGAILLVAGTSITISDRVIANGAGGTGASATQGGGGGGGSGGMIALESPMIILEAGAELSANGGGGGEGTITTNADEGEESTAWNVVAAGGTGGSGEGGAGGAGAAALINAAKGANGTTDSGNDGAGGGGGGGHGVVWLKGTLSGAGMTKISPSPVFK